MFGIGPTELIVILVVALLILGPKRLPEIARSLGKGFAEFKRASNELRSQIDLSTEISSSPPPPAQPPVPTPPEEQEGAANAVAAVDAKPAPLLEKENRLKENLSIWDKADEPAVTSPEATGATAEDEPGSEEPSAR